MEEKINELLKDDAFCKALGETKSPEEASALFAQHGVQITAEELLAAAAQPEGELDENGLDEVAGGCGRMWRWRPIPFIPPWFLRPRTPYRPHGPGGRGRW